MSGVFCITGVIKTNKLHFSFLVSFNNLSSACFKKITIHHKEAVTVYAYYGLYHASVLTSC